MADTTYYPLQNSIFSLLRYAIVKNYLNFPYMFVMSPEIPIVLPHK